MHYVVFHTFVCHELVCVAHIKLLIKQFIKSKLHSVQKPLQIEQVLLQKSCGLLTVSNRASGVFHLLLQTVEGIMLFPLLPLLLQIQEDFLHGVCGLDDGEVIFPHALHLLSGLLIVRHSSILQAAGCGHGLQSGPVLQHQHTGLLKLLWSRDVIPAHRGGWWQPEALGAVGRSAGRLSDERTVCWETAEELVESRTPVGVLHPCMG